MQIYNERNDGENKPLMWSRNIKDDQKLTQKLKAVKIEAIRRFFGIFRKEKLRNYQRINRNTRNDNRRGIPQQTGNHMKKRKRQRPRQSWLKGIKHTISAINVFKADIYPRNEWRLVIGRHYRML